MFLKYSLYRFETVISESDFRKILKETPGLFTDEEIESKVKIFREWEKKLISKSILTDTMNPYVMNPYVEKSAYKIDHYFSSLCNIFLDDPEKYRKELEERIKKNPYGARYIEWEKYLNTYKKKNVNDFIHNLPNFPFFFKNSSNEVDISFLSFSKLFFPFCFDTRFAISREIFTYLIVEKIIRNALHLEFCKIKLKNSYNREVISHLIGRRAFYEKYPFPAEIIDKIESYVTPIAIVKRHPIWKSLHSSTVYSDFDKKMECNRRFISLLTKLEGKQELDEEIEWFIEDQLEFLCNKKTPEFLRNLNIKHPRGLLIKLMDLKTPNSWYFSRFFGEYIPNMKNESQNDKILFKENLTAFKGKISRREIEFGRNYDEFKYFCKKIKSGNIYQLPWFAGGGKINKSNYEKNKELTNPFYIKSLLSIILLFSGLFLFTSFFFYYRRRSKNKKKYKKLRQIVTKNKAVNKSFHKGTVEKK